MIRSDKSDSSRSEPAVALKTGHGPVLRAVASRLGDVLRMSFGISSKL